MAVDKKDPEISYAEESMHEVESIEYMHSIVYEESERSVAFVAMEDIADALTGGPDEEEAMEERRDAMAVDVEDECEENSVVAMEE